MTPFDSRFARSVLLTDGSGERGVRAFIQPVSVKDPERPSPTAAGVVDERRWLLIMEPVAPAGPAEIVDGGRVYSLLRWEEVGGHVEGLLCLKGGAGDA